MKLEHDLNPFVKIDESKKRYALNNTTILLETDII